MTQEYPIGIQDFEKLRTGNFYYVDKTDYVFRLADTKRQYFLSRPRRFGKSLLLSTLKYYFEGRRELFDGLKIASLETEWTARPVFYLSFAHNNYIEKDALTNAIDKMLRPYENEYGGTSADASVGDRFFHLLKTASETTGRKCAVLIDEYDKPLLDVFGTEQETRNLATLSAFFGVMKDADPHLQFVLVTGITKFAHVNLFSGGNQLDDISMADDYDAVCGVTEEELKNVFADGISALGARFKMSADAVLANLKKLYDGYHFSIESRDIYNPFSLIKCFQNRQFGSYWFSSATPSSLLKMVSGSSNRNVEMFTDRFLEEQQFAEYRASKNYLLPILYQAGYLTIKEVRLTGINYTYRLGFPNVEVKKGYTSVVLGGYLAENADEAFWITDVNTALRDGRPDDLRRLFGSFFAGIPYSLRPHKPKKKSISTDYGSCDVSPDGSPDVSADEWEEDWDRPTERFFHLTFFLIFNLLSTYTVLIEKQNACGRADCVVETDSFVYIFEFKLDRPAEAAMAQIDARQYAEPYAADPRKVFRIAATFSSETVTMKSWKAE